jgi:hypothetical protein
VTGLVPCFSSHREMTSTSNIVPSAVQTGWEKGWRDAAQKLKGRRLNEPVGALWDTFEPEFAE